MLPLAFNVVLPPGQIVALGPAFTEGGIPTVIVIILTAVPQLFVTESVYVVVAVGLATGFEIFGLLKPVGGDHEKVPLPVAVVMVTDAAGQMV